MKIWERLSDGYIICIENVDYVTPFEQNGVNAAFAFTIVFAGGSRLTRVYPTDKGNDPVLSEKNARSDYAIFSKMVK